MDQVPKTICLFRINISVARDQETSSNRGQGIRGANKQSIQDKYQKNSSCLVD